METAFNLATPKGFRIWLLYYSRRGGTGCKLDFCFSIRCYVLYFFVCPPNSGIVTKKYKKWAAGNETASRLIVRDRLFIHYSVVWVFMNAEHIRQGFADLVLYCCILDFCLSICVLLGIDYLVAGYSTCNGKTANFLWKILIYKPLGKFYNSCIFWGIFAIVFFLKFLLL